MKTPRRYTTNELSGTLLEINLSLLHSEIGKATTTALDVGQGVHDLLVSLNVGVEDTQNVLEIVGHNEGHILKQYERTGLCRRQSM
jgi:hypothetical protein